MPDAITIRQLHEYGEFLACEDLQRAAWKMTDDRDVVPAHMLSPVAENGGLVLGAFDAQGKIVGFVYGFVGRTDDERAAWMGSPFIFCSEMMGVLPEARGAAVGTRLKLAQREYALAQGYKLITWTYDPLLSLNARLNIAKLGCICRRYVRDAYGPLGGIYAGLSTDRFAVEWWIASERVKSTLVGERTSSLEEWQSQGLRVINPAAMEGGVLRPGSFELGGAGESCLAQIPADFQAIKAADFEAAKAWREHTREVFEAAFGRGYAVAGFAGRAGVDRLSSYYLLTRAIGAAALARE